MKVFMFVYLFNNYDFPIGRCNYDPFSILSEQADRATEKVNHQQIDYNTPQSHQVEW